MQEYVMNTFKIGAIALAMTMLTACGDDDEKEVAFGELKFYNASNNTGVVEIAAIDGDTQYNLTKVDKFNTSPNYYPDVTDYELLVNHQQPFIDEPIVVFQQPFTVSDDILSLLILNGDAKQSELLSYTIDPKSLDQVISDDKKNETNSFEIYSLNLSQNYQNVGLHYSFDNNSFSQAQLITPLHDKQLSESVAMAQGQYTFFITDEQGQLIYQSEQVAVEYQDSYIFAIRDDVNGKNLVIDRFSKTSPVYHHYSTIAPAELRFYQSDNTIGNVDLYIGDIDGEPSITDLAADSLSQSITTMAGDITLSLTLSAQAQQVVFDNSLVSLAPRDDKNVLFYQDEDEIIRSIVFENNNDFSVYESTITIVNLTQQEHAINAYLVDENNSISQTPFNKENVAFSQYVAIDSAQQQFEVVITNTPTSDASDQFVLAQSSMIEFSENTNYLIIVEPDTTASSGFSINVIKQ